MSTQPRTAVHRAAQRIVDGSRRVDVAGLQGTVVELHKVDGGYLLGRKTSAGHDIVYVTTSGSRKVVTKYWAGPSEYWGGPPRSLVVAGSGSQIVYNATRFDHVRYKETRTATLRGTVTAVHPFPEIPPLAAFGRGAVLLTNYPGVEWWDPWTDELADQALGDSIENVDLSAEQIATRGDGYAMRELVAGAPTQWTVPQEDWGIGAWSPDDSKVLAHGEVDDEGLVVSQLVLRASDGAWLASLGPGASEPGAVWESGSTILFRATDDYGATTQIMRCTLSGSCARVGAPFEDGPRAGLVLVTRRNS